MFNLRNKVRHIKRGFLKRDFLNKLRYGNQKAPRALETIWINSREVNAFVDTTYARRDSATVVAGDWDLKVVPIDSLEKIRCTKRHFIEGIPWPETGIYAYMQKLIDEYGSYDGCVTIDDIKQRYHALDDLYDYLSHGGQFKTRTQLDPTALGENRGILIHVGRNGELLFSGAGCHRLAIAQVLGLEKIPALLGVVHEQAVMNGVMSRYRQ